MGQETPAAAEGSVPRRQALCGIIALGVLGPTALAACSKDKEFGQPAADPATGAATPPSAGAPPTGGAPGKPPGTGAPAGNAIAQLSQVPQGGGTVVSAPDGRQLVVVRTAAGAVKAYDAHCTHQGTIVGAPKKGVMTCPNHGSRFKSDDGSVVNGPAAAPLKEVQVQVQGDSIVLA